MCRSWLASDGGLTDDLLPVDRVHIHCRGNGHLWFRPYGESLWQTPEAGPAQMNHFHPMGFEASMDAPGSMIARLFDRASGETMIAIAGIPCSTVMNAADVERIIEAVEDELEAFIPPVAFRSYA
jgi:hypothetical protein